ncbi:hypothetical protein [Salinisphaera sp. T31B1]|uniref:hypothetical protein n=1 Tax=Salinisphaera sp. T31B1 TaxID=727963 RepID=UPI00333F1BF9
MPASPSATDMQTVHRWRWVAGAVISSWGLMTGYAVTQGLTVLAGLTTLQALAMAVGAWLALGVRTRVRVHVLDAIAAGVLIGSAIYYVLPAALVGHPLGGAAGLLLGAAVGGAIHQHAGGQAHRSMLAGLSLHAASAGLVLGVVYTGMPALGLSLGLAIVAHKLPAGYALAGALRDNGDSIASVALPACAIGLVSLPVALLALPAGLPHGLLFGLASGLFLTVAGVFVAQLPWQGLCRIGFIVAQILLGLAAVVLLDRLIRGPG